MKEKLKNQNGITLVALVITIILMLILASITVTTIINGGLFNYAGKAKQDMEIASEKETLQKVVIVAETTSKTGRITENDMQNAINTVIDNEGATLETENNNFLITFTNSNRTYLVDENGELREVNWTTSKDSEGNNVITNGDVTLTIGDYIIYNPNSGDEKPYTHTAETEKTGTSEDQNFSTENASTNWRLLGIEYKSDGDYLIIVPETPIQSTESTGLMLQGANGYKNGIEEIENICKTYGNGDGAEYARAMKVEDVNKITGYDPLNTGDGTIYKEGEWCQYLSEITATRSSFNVIDAIFSNGEEASYTYPNFLYWNENDELVLLGVNESVTRTITHYFYYPTTLTENSSGDIKGLSTSSREYSILFDNNKSYWLASKYSLGSDNMGWSSNAQKFSVTVNYGLFIIRDSTVGWTSGVNYLKAIGGNEPKLNHSIMPMVYLQKDIELEPTENKINGCTQWQIKKS